VSFAESTTEVLRAGTVEVTSLDGDATTFEQVEQVLC
jgi:hypothetical protein